MNAPEVAAIGSGRSGRPVFLALLMASLGGVAGSEAVARVRAGSFAKSTALAPVTQVVAHGLGEVPKALIVWTDGRAGDDGVVADLRFGFGVSDGALSYAAGTVSRDGLGAADSSRRIATAIVTLVDSGEVVVAEATLAALDDSTFSLGWTVNDNVASVVHFLAIGGDGVSAKVLSWTMRFGSIGPQSIVGVGFQPSSVLHVHVGAGFTSPPPASGGNGCLGLGVMDEAGGQWAMTFFGLDGASPPQEHSYQRTDRAIAGISSAGAVAKEASYLSMDPDGFSVNWSTVDGDASRIVSLALAGVRVRAGSFLKAATPAPAENVVGGVGLRPGAVLLLSAQETPQSVPVTHSRLGIGVAASGERSVAAQALDGSSPTRVDGALVERAFTKLWGDPAVIAASARLLQLGPDGFSLEWLSNDAVATEILYLAIEGRRRIWTFD